MIIPVARLSTTSPATPNMDTLANSAYFLAIFILAIGAVLIGESMRSVDIPGSPLTLCLPLIVGFTISYALAYVIYIVQNIFRHIFDVLVAFVVDVHPGVIFAARSTYTSSPAGIVDTEKAYGSFGMVASPAFDDLKIFREEEDAPTPASLTSHRCALLVDLEDANLPSIMCTSPTAEVLADTPAESDIFLLTIERAIDTFNLSRPPAEDTFAFKFKSSNTPVVKLAAPRRRIARLPAAVVEIAPWSVRPARRSQVASARVQAALPALAEDEGANLPPTAATEAPALATANSPRAAPSPRCSQLKLSGGQNTLPVLDEEQEEEDLPRNVPAAAYATAPACALRAAPSARRTHVKTARAQSSLQALVEDEEDGPACAPAALRSSPAIRTSAVLISAKRARAPLPALELAATGATPDGQLPQRKE